MGLFKKSKVTQKQKPKASGIDINKSYTLPVGSKYIVETNFGTMYSAKHKGNNQRFIKNTLENRYKISKVKGSPIRYDNMTYWY